jgi:hypothetical protein
LEHRFRTTVPIFVALAATVRFWPAGNLNAQRPNGLAVVPSEHATNIESKKPDQSLTNDSIVKLVGAGIHEDTIISVIRSQPGNYSLGTDDIIALKQAGVSEKTITAMLSSAGNAGVRAFATRSGAALDINVPKDPGLYALVSNGTLRHIAGRPTSFTRTGSWVTSDLTLGIHARRTNTQVAGKSAYVTVGRTPVFYYRAAQDGSDQVVPGTLNLILTRMTVTNGRRQFELEASGAFRRSQGISVRHQRNFAALEIESGLYEARPDQLRPGQYAFFLYVAGASADRPREANALTGFIYDFQVE